jgi:hypothetical protein
MKKVSYKRPKIGPRLSHADRLERAIGLDRRAEFAQAQLERLQGIFKALLADENFLTLLRAESITTIPNHLKITMEGAATEVPKKPLTQDGGDRHRKWDRTQKASLLRLSSEPPKTLGLDQLTLTICCRYANSLLANPKIKQYLAKHHSLQSANLDKLIEQCEQCVKQEGIHSVLSHDGATRK